jgi:RNA-directed DNA polymerase
MSDYSALFKLLKVQPSEFFAVLDKKSEYHFVEITKKKGGKRKLSVPSDRLSVIQKRLLYRLEEDYFHTEGSHGFTLGRSIKTNASLHVGKHWVLNMDIEDFFPSITERRVWGALTKWKKFIDKWKLSKKEVFMLAKICSHEGMLPQGAPTSPFLSNLVCRRLDWQLGDFARNNKLTYSRYCDDISFSPNTPSVQPGIIYEVGSQEISDELIDLFEKNNFSLNKNKTRLFTKPRPLRVTGLVVNKTTNLPRIWIRNLRAMLHDWEMKGEQNAAQRFRGLQKELGSRKKSFPEVLLGKIQYLSMIKGKGDPVYLSLRKRFLKLNLEAEQRLRVNLDDYSIRTDVDALVHEDFTIRKHDQKKSSSFLSQWAKMRMDYLIGGFENIRKEFLGERVYEVLLQAEKLYLLNEIKGISDQSDSFRLFKTGWDRIISKIGDECGNEFSKLPFKRLNSENTDLKDKLKEFWKSQGIDFRMAGSRGSFKSIYDASSNKGVRGQGFPAFILFISLGKLNGDAPSIIKQRKRLQLALNIDQNFGSNFNILRKIRNADKRRLPEIDQFRTRLYRALRAFGSKLK